MRVRRFGVATLAVGLVGVGAGCAGTEADAGAGAACGISVCAVDEEADDEAFDPDEVATGQEIGKSDAADEVAAKVVEVTADGALSIEDVDALFEAGGARVTVDEMLVIRGALHPAADAGWTVDDAALAHGRLRARVSGLPAEEAEAVASGTSFGGTVVPEAVTALLAEARLQGAVAYDVAETDEDGDPIWSPYPATTPPEGNMSFAYTEITPDELAADAADTEVEYNAIVGEEEAVTPWGQKYRRARYERRKGGTGHILAHYDEVYHDDLYARGGQGQKWANNFAILSDGSIHCLPAARRSERQDLILTNPHLSRGLRVLFNGHLDVRAGVVEGVEMSGRLSKLAARGKAVFIDPIALLEAWGFEIDPALSLWYGNTASGTPVREGGVIKQAEAR